MAIYRCKGCGGELNVSQGKTIAECDFCGVLQTVPSAMDENLQGLFNRANILRMKSEFDKAESIYEKIVQADSTQSEAYWGLILCKFGIEYVEDPVSFKRIPTCHRTLLESIIADDDYKAALLYADADQRNVYEAEAKEIDRLQKEIIALSQREDAYDVFICYKETDEFGKRTQDSVIANEIYYQLTQEGFKVFFAAITLEDKLGSAYEPCIFAALNSAKVMLSIGTKPEYFNAVWVKNEWSRFLKIMKKDRSKILIPCYRDMDAYELPEEFAHLQAQDMSKIGFINDVVRGIKKVLSDGKNKVEQAEVPVTNNTNIAPLLQRVFIFLEDGDWESADEYCEKVLDLEPRNATAYFGKLMAELKVRSQNELVNCNTVLEKNGNYQKAVRFADQELKERLMGINQSIQERMEKELVQGTYNKALSSKNTASTEEEYKKAAAIFETIPQLLDSVQQARECLQKAEEIRKDKIYISCKRIDSGEIYETEENLENAIGMLRKIADWRDSARLIEQYERKLAEMIANKESMYNRALCDFENADLYLNANRFDEAFAAYTAAQRVFSSLNDYKDSKFRLSRCEQKQKMLADTHMPTLTLAVLDSKNPLALADGAHFVYDITENRSRKQQKVIVELKKGISTQSIKLEPGDYTIGLRVYGWTSKPEIGDPMHKNVCTIHIGWGQKCRIVSNRPAFGKLKMDIEFA